MHLDLRRAAPCALLSLALAACGAAPIDATLGGFMVHLEPASATLAVRSSDGRLLLDGGGIGFRTATASYQELVGAFLIDETAASDWRDASAFSDVVLGADRISFRIEAPAQGAQGELRSLADGVLQLALTHGPANRTRVSFSCAADEQFLGFGAQPMDVAARGQTVPIWVSEQGIGRVDSNEPTGDWFLTGTRHQSYAPDPFFVSSHGFGVSAEGARRSIFSMCSDPADRWRVEAWDGALTLDLFDGPSPLEVLRRRSDRVGRAAAPPAWTWAPWHDAIFGSAEVRHVAALLRDNQIPSAAIWTEDWAGGTHGGGMYSLTYDWHVDRTLYPDVEKLAAELHGAGFKFLGYFNTFVEQDSDHFQQALDGGYLIQHADGTPYLFNGARIGNTSLVDLSNTAARAWMAAAMNEALDLGFDGWMADYGEWLPVDSKLASGEDGEAAHNAYPLAWQKLNEEVLAGRPDAQSFVRSAWLGSAAVQHQVVWGGDQLTSFDPGDGLPTAVAIGIGLGLAGLPYYGSDIAGYFSGLGRPAGTEELFYRWTSFGALTPIMRTHHGVEAGMNWSWTSDAASLAHHKRWAEIHVRLFPYLRAAADEAARSGAPMMRAVALGFPEDPAAWSLGDEYLLGPALLVAPVIAEGAVSRSVYFPAGRWLPLFGATNAAPIDGPVRQDVDAPREALPVYGRAGALIPLTLPGVQTLVSTGAAGPPGLEAADAGRELVILLGANGALTERGATYTLTSTAPYDGSAALSWAGAPLASCDPTMAPPCVTVASGNREAIAHLTGDGELRSTDGAISLSVVSAAPGPLLLHLRW